MSAVNEYATTVLRMGQQPGTKEILQVREAVLSVFRDLLIEDSIMPIGLLKNHIAKEESYLLPQVLRGLVQEGLIKFAYSEGYELGVRCYARSSFGI